LKENPESGYLLGCTDEISHYNYNIDRLAGWFREEPVLNTDLFQKSARGTIAGEGSFMVWMNNKSTEALAELKAVKTIHSNDPEQVSEALKKFLSENLPENELPGLLLTGENGDERLLPYCDFVESCFDSSVTVGRFKHLCGEYCTASSFAVWLSIQIFATGVVPASLIKKNSTAKPIRHILIYNNYRGRQHAFILVSAI
jgi:hypothetical protein